MPKTRHIEYTSTNSLFCKGCRNMTSLIPGEPGNHRECKNCGIKYEVKR